MYLEERSHKIIDTSFYEPHLLIVRGRNPARSGAISSLTHRLRLALPELAPPTMVLQHKFLVPLFPAGQEPLPPGIVSDEDKLAYDQQKKVEKYMGMAAESCVFKSSLSGVMGS